MLYSERGNSGLRVTACSREALKSHVRVGMPLAEARSLCRGLGAPTVCVRSDPEADRQALRQLAFDSQRYTPITGLEETDTPESLWLDIAGCEHLYGGERGLSRAIFVDFNARGYEARIATAETLGAAWALAHYGNGWPAVAGARQRAALQGLPVAALRLAEPILRILRELDVLTIQDLQRLPRSSLPARFGSTILQRLDQALGDCPETFTPEKCVEPITAAWAAEEPFTDRRDVAEVFRQLLDRLLQQLSARPAGVLELVCSFQAEQAVPAVTLQLSQPTVDAAHLRQLFELRCEQQDWRNGISGLRVEIARVGWLRETPRSLFDDEPGNDPRAIEALMERLSSRLGENSVMHPFRVPDPLPEAAYRLVSWFDKERLGRQTKSTTPRRQRENSASASPEKRPPLSFESRQRPWRLLPTPQRLEVVALFPEGPPQRIEWNGQWQQVSRSWGPERIETGWWRERDLGRDYYRVETERGPHWWIFREHESGHWFLHGWF